MSTQLSKKSVARNYAFLAVMLGAMILGSIVGWIFPQELDAEGNVISAGATVLEPLGTLFLNMMFCIVVPMVFSSIAGSVATMKSRKRAGKIMGTTVLTFVITGAIAAVIMIVIMKIFPPVLEPWTNLTEGVVEDHLHPGPDRELLHGERLLRPAQPQRHAAPDRLLHSVRLRRKSGAGS